jgi:lon-related putative ATP-dependent protease
MTGELSFDQCRNICPEIVFECESSADLTPLVGIIGQDRAVRALQFGLNIEDRGFNIYVSGIPGTGRRTAIVDFVRELAKSRPVPNDWCYVNNFKDPTRPKVIGLPPGKGSRFKKEMEKFVAGITGALKSAFESDDYINKRTAMLRSIEEERSELSKTVDKIAEEGGFAIQQSQIGLILIPVIDGRPITDEEFLHLPPALQQRIQKKREVVQNRIFSVFRSLRDLERRAEEIVSDLNKQVANFAMEPFLASLREEFGDSKDVLEFLKEVQENIIENLPIILQGQQKEAQIPFLTPPVDPIKNYAVNLVVDNSNLQGAPVVIELNPSYSRLFGVTEKEARFGALVTDFTMIRGGAAHRANGGFLVLPVEELLRDALIWESLKQALANEVLEIEEPAVKFGYVVTKTLRPGPIPFKTKVILMGNPMFYDLLYSLDKDFRELFKVKADFDTTMERNDENIKKYASFICTLCEKEHLLHLDPSGLAAAVEYGSRLADDQNKLSTRFSEISDVIREANYYARQDGAKLISKKHVDRALEERVYRSNMVQEKIQEAIMKGLLLIDTDGERVGQVNGLAVMSVGDYTFGKPSKITASIGVGREGIIDIERESQMGGPTHTKGVMILGGYLNDRYAREKPLSLTAKIVFEQSYSGVDGDSASSTELYAILSALSEKPIKQYLAVTGSVNQKGEVQAIGGVNEKIEGFFEVCKFKGFTGKQGVVIPESNVQNLMLKEEVVEAVKEGKFHIYPVNTIDEGMEILTGVKAGQRMPDGSFEKGSINDLVQKRLSEMADRIKEYRL